MVIDPSKPIEIVYLYNSIEQKDVFTFKLLYNHLAQLRRKKLIHEWESSLAGTTLQDELNSKLEQAHIIILLISSSFNAEDRYSGAETVELVRKCFDKGACVWPIIIGPVYLSSYSEYDTFYGQGEKAVQSSASQDEACRQIASKIGAEIVQMLSKAWAHNGDKCYRQMYLSQSLSVALSAYECSLSYVHNYPPALLGKGRILHKQGKLEEARQYFGAIVSPNTSLLKKEKDAIPFDNQHNSLEYACYRGHALLELKQFPEARQAFQEVYQHIALPVDSTQRKVCAEAYCGEGDACRMLGNQVADSTTHYNLALEAYYKAIELVPDNPIYLLGMGKTYIGLANSSESKYFYEKALDIYKQITHRWPDYVTGWVEKGNTHYYLHQANEALVAYNQALTLQPYEVHAYGGKGYAMLELENPNEALAAFEKALSLERNESGYLYGQGLAQASLGRYQDAITSYDKSCDCGFAGLSLVVYRAIALLELGDTERLNGKQAQEISYYKDAFDSFNNALKRGWREPDIIHYGLGKIFFAYGHWNSALQHYKQAIDLAPYKADAYLELGKTQIALGNNEEGVAAFEQASLHCHHPESTITRADTELAYGDFYSDIAGTPTSKNYYIYQEKARASYQRVVHMNESVLAYIGLGKAYAALHYNKEAIDTLSHALYLNPQLAECYFIKGRCYYELGQFTEAYSLYERAISFGFNTVSVRIAQGEALLAMKSYIKAIKVFDDIIEESGEETAYAYCEKGFAFHALGKNDEALQSFCEADRDDSAMCSKPRYRHILQDIRSSLEGLLHGNPYDAFIYKQKGDVLLLLRESVREAIEAYSSAIKYAEGSADVYYRRGEVYNLLYESNSSLKEYSQAFKNYKTALELDANHIQARHGKETIESTIAQQGLARRVAFWLMTMF